MLKAVTRRVAGRSEAEHFHPALVEVSPGIRTMALIAEDHGDGTATVYTPLAPTPGIGTLQIVEERLITRLDTPVGDFLTPYWQWGVGSRDAVGRSDRGPPQP